MFDTTTKASYKQQIEDLEDKVAGLEADIRAQKREITKGSQEVAHYQRLKLSHEANLDREEELAMRERELDKTDSEMAIQIRAKQDALNIQNKAEQARLDATRESQNEREARILERQKRVEAQTAEAVKAAMHEGYASGLKDGLSKLGELRSLDATNAQELLKLHTVGAHLPTTLREDENNPMSAAYAELGTKLVTKLMDKDEDD